MATIGYSSWAVDLAEVGAIYPFQGSEVLLTIIGVVLWLGWHVLQIKSENRQIEEAIAQARPEDIARHTDAY